MIDFGKKLLKLFPALLIFVLAIGISAYWLMHRPKPEKTQATVTAPLVEILAPTRRELQTSVYALGNVVAAQSVNLNSRVDGVVASVSPQFIEGGLLKKGEQIVSLDPTDYALKVRQAENELARARFNLKLELGQQAIAKREYEMLGQKLDALATELVQRQPHLEAAKAAVRAAEATLERAQLDLQRTKTLAPFNAVVTGRNANIGSWVSTVASGTPMVKLAGTDEFWVDISIPVDKLRWLFIPDHEGELASAARISFESAWGAGVYRQGTIKRLKAEVDSEGRMAKLLVEVKDPMSLQPVNRGLPTLMLGTLVRVKLAGKTLPEVLELPESTLHDGSNLWLLTENQTLDIRKVEPVWAEPGHIYLQSDQLPENARIITSDLPTPVKGMQLSLQTTPSQNLTQEKQGE